ncbi:MAG TPA: RcnB family protein [Sphingomicrobium sp.]|nr:RcnB family protein [Sphingomicrobium sp.]
MNRLLCAVAAIALIAPAAASAQRQDNRHNGDRTEHSQGRPQHQQQQQNRQDRQNRSGRMSRSDQMNRSDGMNRTNRPNGTRVTRVTRTTNVTRPAGERTTRRVTNVYRIGRRPTSFHRIRTSAFRYPRGYHYRRFRIGSILPSLFLSSLYFWSDYGALGLGAPPPGYVWVRYGPDLLLVNRFNGRIADVIYGAFY